jgi:bile acid:Na+ symporter, BASS family
MVEKLTKLFPVWAILLSITAYFYAGFFSGFKSAIIPLLTVVMFGMGMTLKWSNFKEVLKSPKVILLGVCLQYLIMPLSAFVISESFGLSAELTAGMILVGSCPGGTASNVITYLAEGDVALSITLTLSSTIIAVVATPAFSLLYLNHIIPVPFWDMMLSILQIVLIPVLLGTAINSFFGEKMDKIRNFFPFLSTISIVLIIAIIVGLNRDKIGQVDFTTILAVILHNISGLVFGYWLTRLFGYDEKTCRTISIEVGMQNSGLSVALAIKYFSAIAALPGAIFSIWHNLSGSLLAGCWSFKNKILLKNISVEEE